MSAAERPGSLGGGAEGRTPARGEMTPLQAALAVADDLGLAVETPRVISERFNLVVHLAPSPIVARVPRIFGRRAEARARLARDLLVSAHAASLGAPVVAPATVVASGPHSRAGWVVGLFDHAVHESGAVADPEAIGNSLRTLHDSLAGYPGPLPPFDPIAEPARLLNEAGDSPEAAFLREILPSLDVPDVPGQALHGDASYRNVLVTADGPRWIDLESASRGPIEWDLAEIVTAVRAFGRPADEADRTIASYGEHDSELLEELLDFRAFQHACSIVWYEHSRRSGVGGAAGFVGWLRRRRSVS
jgi:hypothetical protein